MIVRLCSFIKVGRCIKYVYRFPFLPMLVYAGELWLEISVASKLRSFELLKHCGGVLKLLILIICLTPVCVDI